MNMPGLTAHLSLNISRGHYARQWAAAKPEAAVQQLSLEDCECGGHLYAYAYVCNVVDYDLVRRSDGLFGTFAFERRILGIATLPPESCGHCFR